MKKKQIEDWRLGIGKCRMWIWDNFSLPHCLFTLLFWFLLLTTHHSSLIAQNQPHGKFLQDSIKIGQPFQYALSYRHRVDWDIVFPDTTYSFKPFEVRSFEYFPTKTDARGSLDSVVYTLVSFDVQPIQLLALPIFRVMPSDCTAVFAQPDTVILQELVKQNSPSLFLKADTTWLYLPQELNYPLLLMGFMGFWVMFGLIYWLFGKEISRRWQQYLLWRRHSDFISTFQRFERNVNRKQKPIENVENALLLWRNFLEKLEQKPFSTFTTTELVESLQDKRLADALRNIDATVYGGNIAQEIASSLQVLKELATQMYQMKRVEVRMGKITK